MAQNIILVGFMGTGKSTVGQILAEQLGRTFVDTDAIIAQEQDMTIEAIFAEQGEEAFRMMEADLAAELGRESDLVVATGGGMIVNLANRAALMANGFLVCLTARDEIIESRLEQETGRPLADDWRDRLHKRQAIYDSIPRQVDTSDHPPQVIAEMIQDLWRQSQ